jgi:hypothetical protein
LIDLTESSQAIQLTVKNRLVTTNLFAIFSPDHIANSVIDPQWTIQLILVLAPLSSLLLCLLALRDSASENR